jgi:uncharacterized protein YwqG
MKFEKVPEGEKAVDAKALGLRSKLGGVPDWDQEDETPICASCNEPMTFIGQIDSIEHDSADNPHRIDCISPDQQYMFGDVGMIYVFCCIQCLETRSIVQCG